MKLKFNKGDHIILETIHESLATTGWRGIIVDIKENAIKKLVYYISFKSETGSTVTTYYAEDVDLCCELDPKWIAGKEFDKQLEDLLK